MEVCIDALLPDDLKNKEQVDQKESVLKRIVRNVIPKAKGGIVVDGLDGLNIKFPKCCSPIKGEPILGYISRGQGVTVHRADCPRVLDYDPARRVEVQWDTESRQVSTHPYSNLQRRRTRVARKYQSVPAQCRCEYHRCQLSDCRS